MPAATFASKTICAPGNPAKPCEDECRVIEMPAAMAGIVIDGATGLGDRNYISTAASDARWYAQTFIDNLESALRESFASPAPIIDAAMVAAAALEKTAAAFHRAAGDAAPPRYALPSAAGIWFVYTPHNRTLTWAGLGDCDGLIADPSGRVLRLPTGYGRDQPDAYITPLLAAYNILAPQSTDAERMADILPLLRRARSRMNQPGGYWIYGVDPAAAQHQVMGQEELTPGDYKIFLMSDGFERLRSFGLYDDQALIAAAGDKGLAALYQELRAAETEDSLCKRHPRVKKSDDASAVFCTLTVR